MTQLFAEDTVYISEQQDQKSVFKEIAHKLFEKGLVTEEYLDNLIDREEHYPTALPLSPIDSSLPNIAIPHTESQFVNVTRIVPVKLEHAITFHNMILPDEKLEVSFLFMILNNEEKEQAGLLAAIMGFANRDKGVFAFQKSGGQFVANLICFLCRDFTGPEGLPRLKF